MSSGGAYESVASLHATIDAALDPPVATGGISASSKSKWLEIYEESLTRSKQEEQESLEKIFKDEEESKRLKGNSEQGILHKNTNNNEVHIRKFNFSRCDNIQQYN